MAHKHKQQGGIEYLGRWGEEVVVSPPRSIQNPGRISLGTINFVTSYF